MDTLSREREAAQALIEEAANRVLPQSDLATIRARVETAREEQALARRELLASGLDLQRLDALAADRWRLRRERAGQGRQRAIEASAAAANRLAALTPALTALPAEPMNVIVDRVTFIRSFVDAGVVVDSDIASLDNWARYKFEVSGDAIGRQGAGRLSFFTLWRNPRTSAVVINAGARLVVNAHLSVDAEWKGVAAWFSLGGGADARATVRARTTIWAMWDPVVRAIVQDRVLGGASANGGFFGDDDSISIEFNEFLAASGFVVPSQASILIEVELLTEWVAESGSVQLDAESGGFRVSVPHLILTLT